MLYERIECQDSNCEYGKNHCCFGEYDPSQFEGKQITERHKCKCNKKKLIYITLLPPPKTNGK